MWSPYFLSADGRDFTAASGDIPESQWTKVAFVSPDEQARLKVVEIQIKVCIDNHPNQSHQNNERFILNVHNVSNAELPRDQTGPEDSTPLPTAERLL
jgi:hypothetical protein